MRRRSPLLRAFQRGLVRFALAFVAVFIGAGYLASIAHMAFVAHTACAEHGMLVHVQLGPLADPAHVATDVPDPAKASDHPSIASDEHDHCVVGSARPGEGVVARAALSVVIDEAPPPPVAPVAPHPSCERAEPPPQIALLLLSPKISPPG
jgi:hypothetical protein